MMDPTKKRYPMSKGKGEAPARQFSSVAQSCMTPCDPMNPSTPGLPVHHQLPEFTQTHVHWVNDAIQPSCPLSSPSPALSLSQHQGLFQLVGSSQQVTKVIGASATASVLPMNIQGWFPLRLTGLISLKSKGLSRVFSNTIIQNHQFCCAQPSLWSNFHFYTWLLKKTIALTIQDLCQWNNASAF